ncbi:DegT/DnrJ/EryC1/StrS family aminotransferase [Candidatus Borrarchaeum sp.]|uniref:DegT/DnrJ/EryC1/StrS family aminotransferase n=1 Tax=Candidatus Borrarchaeum sp. TaxID=2846742 RepID=UPI00257DD9D6|nr:DegT/DnrJ/EryC1/StrS family aminotransferase [Candidatus Borrarchaeum sp.]
MDIEDLALFGGEPVRKTPISLSKPFITQEEIDNVIEVLRSNWIVQGPRVEEFENNFAEYVGTEYAIAVSSGSAALHLALLSIGVKPNTEVLIPDITCISVPNAVSYVGAFPRFVDVNMNTYNISLEALERNISNKTSAVIPIHLYGHPASLDEILDLSNKYGFFVIEDCAQAHGAEYKGKKVGSFGDIGIFSTYATKNMTTGEGGILVTNRREIAKKVRFLRDQDKSSNIPILAYNYKITDIEAAIGLAQLNKLDKLNAQRISNAMLLSSHLKDIDGVKIPFISNYVKHVFHRYTLFFEPQRFKGSRDELASALEAEGIKNGILYTPPAHRYPYYHKKYNFNNKQFENADLISKSILSIPVHPNLEKQDLIDIVNATKKVTMQYCK